MVMTEIDYTKMVGKNIRRLAYESGKTQADIARDLHLSKATVSSWMNGTRLPRMDKVDLLCHYFNCKRVDIMEEPKNTEQNGYYMDTETVEMAQSLLQNKEMRVLFDAARDAKPEDLKTAADVLLALKRKEGYSGDDPA